MLFLPNAGNIRIFHLDYCCYSGSKIETLEVKLFKIGIGGGQTQLKKTSESLILKKLIVVKLLSIGTENTAGVEGFFVSGGLACRKFSLRDPCCHIVATKLSSGKLILGVDEVL